MSRFLICPRSWRYHYIDKVPRPPADNLIIGSGMHAGIEFNYRQKIKSGKNCVLDDAKAAALEATRSLARNGFTSWNRLSLSDIESTVLYLVDAHHRLVAPKVKPAYVEHEFRINLGDDFPVDLLGYIDCITQDDWIIDNKSWGKAKGQSYADKDMQLTAYSFAFRSEFQRIERGLRFDSILKGNYRYEPIETHRTNLQIRWWLRQVEDVVAAMQAGVDYPNTDSFLCNERYCDYWSMCQNELIGGTS